MPGWERGARPMGVRPMDVRYRDYRALPRLFRRPRLLIIGCGDIGQRVAARAARDWRVYGVARSSATMARIRATGALALREQASAGASRGRSRRRLQDLGDWVVHSAPPPAKLEPDEEQRDGLVIDRVTRRWAVKLLPRPGQGKRMVYLSTTGVYGDRQGMSLDEVSGVCPITDRARRRVDAERRLREIGRRCRRLRVTILRVPGIYAIDRLPLQRLRERLPALLAADDVRTSHIHADDLARMTRVALLRRRAQRIYNVVDDSDLPMGDYLDMVARWAGLAPPPRVDRQTLLATVSPMRASFMSESRRLSNWRMKRELRLPLRYPTVADFLAAQEPPGRGGPPRNMQPI